MNNWKEVSILFLDSDVPRNPEVLYKAYSDEELLRLNAAITEMNGQVAKVWMKYYVKS